uniref:LysE family translocator n=1 Tax=Pararhizobium sp. IMCC3301 TaxID=3067904 RepID=UPI0027426429|nr:LysE family translocator [Pararhizobium sp. IMCC3301]
MPSFEILMPFFIATAIFACIPGPGMLYAAARTLSGGRQAGWLAAIGLHIGGYGHIVATAFGLAVVLSAVPVLYGAVKLAGAAYLVWLGCRMFVARDLPGGTGSVRRSTGPRKAMSQSIVVELLNPKTALFYLSYLPQFTALDAAFPVWLQILILGTIVNLLFSVTDILCVLLSEKAMRLMAASQATNRLARRFGGSVLIALGVNLAVSRQ